jgi:hypothetical protein
MRSCCAAANHPRVIAAIQSFANLPIVPPHFRQKLSAELRRALVTADGTQFAELLAGAGLVGPAQEGMVKVLRTFDEVKERYTEVHKQRDAKAKMVTHAWAKVTEQGLPVRAWTSVESEDAKEARRIAKARARGRRTQLTGGEQQQIPAVLMGATADSVRDKKLGEGLEYGQARPAVSKKEPELEPEPEPEVNLAVEPDPEHESQPKVKLCTARPHL